MTLSKMAFVVGALVLLSGCLSVNYDQEFRADKSSKITETIDFQKTLALLTSLSNTTESLRTTVTDYGTSFSYSIFANYTDSQSGLTHLENNAYASGRLSKKADATDSFSYCGGFTSFSCTDISATDPLAGGTLSLKLTNKVGRKVTLNSFVVTGEGAPNDCTFTPSELETNGAIRVTCKGIVAPVASPTPSPSPTENPMERINSQMDGICANITKGDASVSCVREGTKVIVSKEISKEGSYYEFKTDMGLPYIKYSVEVKSLLGFAGSTDSLTQGLGGSVGSTPKDLTFKDPTVSASLGMIGSSIQMRYTVKMPGTITKAYGGEVDDKLNIAKFDIVKMMQNSENPRVESRELNIPYLIGAAVGVLVLLALLYVFVLKKRGAPTPVSPQGTAAVGSYPPAGYQPGQPPYQPRA